MFLFAKLVVIAVIDRKMLLPATTLLQLGLEAPWKSRYKLRSSVLTKEGVHDAITRVQRWEGFMLDPQAPYRSGFLNASFFYQKPYILGYMGRREVVYFPPGDFEPPEVFEPPSMDHGGFTATDLDVTPSIDVSTAPPDLATDLEATSTDTDATDTSDDGDTTPDSAPGDGVNTATNTATASDTDSATATATATAADTSSATDGGATDTSDTAGATDSSVAVAVATSTDDGLDTSEKLDPETEQYLNPSAATATPWYHYSSPPNICLLQVLPTARCLPVPAASAAEVADTAARATASITPPAPGPLAANQSPSDGTGGFGSVAFPHRPGGGGGVAGAGGGTRGLANLLHHGFAAEPGMSNSTARPSRKLSRRPRSSRQRQRQRRPSSGHGRGGGGRGGAGVAVGSGTTLVSFE